MSTENTYDALIIGSGAAGLGLALALANQYRVGIICKDDLLTSASQHAQGGIAAVLDQSDSFESHINDTLIAGAGLCDKTAVTFTITHAKAAILQLIQQGVEFTPDTKSAAHYHLTQEGGHSHRRIIHSADKTGAAVVKTLSQQALEHPNITCMTEQTAIDLIIENNQCIGALVLNNQNETIYSIYAHTTVLATGGASMTYLHTTSPGHTSGDGIAIGFNAGARVANMEFNQFHPTCFYNPGGKTFLITEVMRGEGAKLILPNGQQFMHHHDSRAELAPRDIVSRAINNELINHNLTHIYLDISHEPADKIKRLFPTIYKLCQEQGIDITQDPIPIVPAAHYTCGGIITDLNGNTNINGLFAIGEVACTGLHGANRMASNSLLECLVFANSAANTIQQNLCTRSLSSPDESIITHQDKPSAPLEDIEDLILQLRTNLWDHVSIIRDKQSLDQAQQKQHDIQQAFNTLWQTCKITKPLLELRNMLEISYLTILSAYDRKESRGTHYRSDFPKQNTSALNTILQKEPAGEILLSNSLTLSSL